MISNTLLSRYHKDSDLMATAQFPHDTAHELFGVAEEHECAVEIIKRIVDAGEARAHAAFDDHHGVGLIDVENGHAEDGARLIRARGGIGYIIGANDQRDIRCSKIAVDLFHLN